MIHFFGLQLDEHTAQFLAFADCLNTKAVAVMQVAAVDGGSLYFLCPRGTIAQGLRPVPLTKIGTKQRQRMELHLLGKLTEIVRTTLGPCYEEPHVENGILICPSWTCMSGGAKWLSFMEEDVQDISEFTL